MKWKVLFTLMTILCLSANAKLDGDDDFAGEGEWNEDDYDDWTDRFDEIFKNSDYEDVLNKINQAHDRGFPNDSDSGQIIKEEIEPSDIKNSENEHLNNVDENENKPEISIPELQVEDDAERFFESPEDSDAPEKELYDKDRSIDEEVIGDENMNGNAPPNDYDPLEYEDIDSNNDEPENEDKPIDELLKIVEGDKNAPNDKSVQDSIENINANDDVGFNKPKESPYAEPGNVDANIFDTDLEVHNSDDIQDESAVDVDNDEKIQSANSKSIEVQLENIIQETDDILNNDSNNSNFNDAESSDKEHNTDDDDIKVPKSIIDETQAILNQDSDGGFMDENDESDSLDMMYDDLNEDLKDLLATLDKLQNNKEERDSVEATNTSEDKDTPNADKSNQQKQSNEESSLFLIKLTENEDALNDDEDAKLNAFLKKMPSDVVSSENDNADDYDQYAYDDDDHENGVNIENDHAQKSYGNDALDPNESKYENKEKEDNDDNKNDVKEEVLEEESLEEGKENAVYINDNTTNQQTNKNNETIREKSAEYENLIDVELTSEEKIENFKSKYQNDIELDLALSDITPKNVKLSIDEAVIVTSPNYPSPYDGNTVVDWFFDGIGGSGIELNITDFSVDGNAGDYLLVKPGRSDADGSDGLIFSYMLRNERRYRFFDVDSMFVRFEAKGSNLQNFEGFQFSVKFIAPRVDRNPEPEPIPEPVAQVPEETLTVYLTGLTHHEFRNISDDFRAIVVDMVAMYIDRENIDAGILPLSDVVQLTRVTVCNINWPYHESCTAVTFGAPLFYNSTEEEHDYQLSRYHLSEMWLEYSRMDPFAVRLRLLGITEYEVPNERAIVSAWWLASFVVFLLAMCLGFGLWRCNCFAEYNGMTRLREDADSIGSARKSDLSLYPTPHQNLPPMFSDGHYDSYLDGDYAPNVDTTRVDMGGAFDNKNFVRDGELMDLDSDEEIIMSLPDDGKTSNRHSYSSGIRPRDVYDV